MGKDRLHILFVSHEYFDDELPDAGGIGHFLETLSKLLVKKGHTVTVMGYSSKKLIKNTKGVDLRFFKSYISYFQGVYDRLEQLLHLVGLTSLLIPLLKMDRKRLAKEVKEFTTNEEVDIIELNDYLGDGAYLSTDIPSIVRSHGSYTMLHNEAGFRPNTAFEYFEKLQAQKVEMGIGVSNFSSSMLAKYFNLSDVVTIYNGLDYDSYRATEIKNHNRIFYFGTLSEAKGMDRLVNTFNQLIARNPNLDLFIAGKVKAYFEKVMWPRFTEQAKKNVHFLGYLSKDQIRREIEESTLVYFPSRIENFSLALLESMACARGVVCWDISAFREVIKHKENGLIVADVEQAVDDIEALFKNKSQLQNLAKNARETIENEFTWETKGRENIEYYIACIAKHGRKVN